MRERITVVTFSMKLIVQGGTIRVCRESISSACTINLEMVKIESSKNHKALSFCMASEPSTSTASIPDSEHQGTWLSKLQA